MPCLCIEAAGGAMTGERGRLVSDLNLASRELGLACEIPCVGTRFLPFSYRTGGDRSYIFRVKIR